MNELKRPTAIHTGVERAIREAPGAGAAATRSLSSWRKREKSKGTAKRQKIEAAMARTSLPMQRAKLQEELKTIDESLREIDNRVLQEPVKKGGFEGSVMPIAGGVEMRLVTSPTGASLSSRASDERKSRSQQTLKGLAAVYNSDSEDLGGFIETLAKGAFKNVLAEKPDVRALVNHDSNLILGRTGKNLRLASSAQGPQFWLDVLPDGDPLTEATVLRVQQGLWTGMSFAFTSNPDSEDWLFEPGETPRRIIYEITGLYDVSIVSYPAYPASSVKIEEPRAKAAAPRKDEVFEGGEHENIVAGRGERDAAIGARHRRLGQVLERQQRERARVIKVGYRKAGRILNRLRPQLSGCS